MSYRIIQNILDTQLATVAGIPTIVKENKDKTNCTTGYYVRPTFLPARTDTVSVGETGYDRFKGLYQIDLMYPTNEDTDAANYMTDKIIESFPKKTILTSGNISVRIVNYWREVGTEYDTLFMIPVFIQWETYKMR